MKEKMWFVVTLLLLFVACSNEGPSYKATNMKGNLVSSNPFEYLVEFGEFDGTYKKSIILHNALGVEVQFESESGTMSIEIRDEDDRLIYIHRKEANMILDKKYVDVSDGKYELIWTGTKVKNGKISVRLF